MSYKGIYVTVTHIFMIKVKVVRLVIYDFRLNMSNKLIREKSTTLFSPGESKGSTYFN